MSKVSEACFWSISLIFILFISVFANADPFGSGQATDGPMSAEPSGGSGGGVSGPVSSTDNAVCRFNGVGGDTLDESGLLIDDSDNLSGISNLTVTGTTTLSTSLDGPLKASSGTVSASNINMSSEVTGTLPISNGGTGQTAQTAAFDALSPTTTKGDLIVSDGSNNVRFPVCSNGEIIEADSSTSSGWACVAPSSGSAWGDITGTLSNQTDLQDALDAKVAGPASATDNAIAIYDGTTGKLVQDQDVATIDTANNRLLFGQNKEIHWDRTVNQSGGKIEFTSTPNQYTLQQTSFGLFMRVPGSTYLYQQAGATWNVPNGYLEVGANSTSFGNFTIRGRNVASLNSLPTNLTIRSGEALGTASTSGGDMVLQAGDSTSTTSGSNGGDLTLRAGDSTNNNSGSVLIREGLGNVDGIVEIGDATAQNTHRLNISTETAGSNTATLTNSPASAGNPDIWIRININGTDYVMPAWQAP